MKQTDENGKPLTYWGGLEEPKQEPGKETADYIDRHIVEALVEVAKQKMYSEEDLKEAFFEGQFGKYSFNDWFEQFKKK
jgi:hypothetical protein